MSHKDNSKQTYRLPQTHSINLHDMNIDIESASADSVHGGAASGMVREDSTPNGVIAPGGRPSVTLGESLEPLLERIAAALERIAMALEADTESAVIGDPVMSTEPGSLPVIEASGDAQSDVRPVLESFLTRNNIYIKALPRLDAADDVIDGLAYYLGDRWDALSGIIAKIKRAMQKGLPITESLKNRSQVDVSSVCQFCTRLHDVAFLEYYQYVKSPVYLIKAKTTTLPSAQRFFSGQWLERYILQKVKGVHASLIIEFGGGIGFEYMINPQITVQNGDDFELDVICAIGKSIYWIEAKTGDYQQHVSKYSKFARSLGLDVDHSFMVLPDASSDRCEALTALFSMTVGNLRTFEERLTAIARRDFVRNNV
ncbi:hypothetical protein JW905_11080 [bacterium]|nr:hypothetical protein [candidate division CSSED10-310 bacterium]